MKNLLTIIFAIALFLSANSVFSQKKSKPAENALSKSTYANQVLRYFSENKGKLEKKDLENLVISDQYYSKSSGITHLYLQQTFEGIKIHNAISSVGIKDENIFHVGNVFKTNISQKVNTKTPSISAQQAIENAANHFKLGNASGLRVIENTNNEYTFSNGNISEKNIPVGLVYTPTKNGELRLSWNMEIYTLDHKNMWSVRIDAENGRILDQLNYVVSCNFGGPNHSDASHKIDHQDLKEDNASNFNLFKTNVTMMVDGSSYRVFDLPKESPSHGNIELINDPANINASPFGWHDTDGRAGAEYTITRGNNVYAQEDIAGDDGFGDAPDGGTNLTFDFPVDLTLAPSSYTPGATTNLFYGNNMMHDIWYVYGFDEASGNFQENNYGNGGIGNDFVIADAQDGAGFNNANFGTPPDGGNGRMQMFLWSAPNPDRDGDFDNGIVAHEYGHGISIRLGGGPSTSGCLSGQEQQGEGWSDWFGLMITMEAGDTGPDVRGIGTYALNQPVTGGGIRTHPYSTSLSVNPHTYDDIKNESVPHGVGSVWAAILWDLTWAYIDKYGWDADLYNGTGGNNKVMQIVLDGLKLQPCGSGFIDSRDAILAADIAAGGADQCLIWEVFARRGLGASADQGSASSRSDGTEAFDLPEALITVSKTSDSCGNEIPQIRVTNFSGADISSFEYSYTIDGGAPVTDTFTDNIAACGTGLLVLDLGPLTRGAHTVDFSIVSPAGSKSFVVLANDSGTENEVNTFEAPSDELITNDSGTWERGMAAGIVLSGPIARSKVYATNLDGEHGNGKNAYLISQCYDLSNLENAVLKFNMAFDIENNWDLMYMEYSKDGQTWEVLGTAADPDWYNSDRVPGGDCFNCVGAQWTGEGNLPSSHSDGGTNASSMKKYSYALDAFDSSGTSENNMLFRFAFISDGAVVEEGVMIDNFVIEGDAVLSVEDNEFNNSISIFPNPTNGTVAIKSTQSIENASVAVYDVMGRILVNKISTNTIDSNRINLNITSLSSGAYFLKITNNGRQATKRIIKN